LSVVREAQHIVVRGLPLSATSQDLRRMVMQADLKGVNAVSLYYRHFRPTGKAILTMALPDYTRDALRGITDIIVPGHRLRADLIEHPAQMYIPPANAEGPPDRDALGNGPGAGVPEGRTVTIAGVPGKRKPEDIRHMLKGFRLAKDQKPPVQLAALYVSPARKYTLYSRFTVYLESESEAQRLVRKLHMTRYKNIDGAPLIRATIIS
ncbi:hypothetical protein GALMADRAFT_59579, partial [Galerina marginata CBS 339.88]